MSTVEEFMASAGGPQPVPVLAARCSSCGRLRTWLFVPHDTEPTVDAVLAAAWWGEPPRRQPCRCDRALPEPADLRNAVSRAVRRGLEAQGGRAVVTAHV